MDMGDQNMIEQPPEMRIGITNVVNTIENGRIYGRREIWLYDSLNRSIKPVRETIGLEKQEACVFP